MINKIISLGYIKYHLSRLSQALRGKTAPFNPSHHEWDSVSQKGLLNISRNDVVFPTQPMRSLSQNPVPSLVQLQAGVTQQRWAPLLLTASPQQMLCILRNPALFFFFFEKGWGEETLNRRESKQSRLTGPTKHHII